jgi:hypothetical protein
VRANHLPTALIGVVDDSRVVLVLALIAGRAS